MSEIHNIFTKVKSKKKQVSNNEYKYFASQIERPFKPKFDGIPLTVLPLSKLATIPVNQT